MTEERDTPVPQLRDESRDDIPSVADALRILARHAQLERIRGVQHWLDPQLGAGLRDLMRGVTTGLETRQNRAAEQTPPSPGPARRRPVPRAGDQGSVGAPERAPERTTGRAADRTADRSHQPAAESATARALPKWSMPPLAIGREPDWEDRLQALARRASGCLACGLSKTRHSVVFGAGSAQVPLVFIGEAPGADEDREGFPFVGKAGQLLTKIISAIGLQREEVYICNVLKCRPPGNRNPAPDEIAHCTPFLQEQLEILKPKVICTLGLFASQYLLGTQAPIGKLRGREFDYRGIPVIPTYHPAALLRNPALKAPVWEDVQLVRRRLDA